MTTINRNEKWFCWKEHAPDGDTTRLLTPWGDPQVHEHPMDWLFETEDKARAAKEEHVPDDPPLSLGRRVFNCLSWAVLIAAVLVVIAAYSCQVREHDDAILYSEVK